jgi:DNA (cytosine-5)-methyltransferase 1
MLNGLDLFSGIGGLALALDAWVRPLAYCEIDPYCQGVLLSRMASGHLTQAPIWDDIRTLLPGGNFPSIDVLYGGFPCQDISIAGNGAGLAGERSGLFSEIVRLGRDLRPRFIFLENVPAITTRGGHDVVGAFTAMGYDCRWCVISAASVGAPHLRERWFLLARAHGDNGGIQSKPREPKKTINPCGHGEEKSVANARRPGRQEFDAAAQPEKTGHDSRCVNSIWHCDWWATEPSVGRVAHGVSHRVDRIKALGNAVVPQQARQAFELLSGINRG